MPMIIFVAAGAIKVLEPVAASAIQENAHICVIFDVMIMLFRPM